MSVMSFICTSCKDPLHADPTEECSGLVPCPTGFPPYIPKGWMIQTRMTFTSARGWNTMVSLYCINCTHYVFSQELERLRER